MSKKKRFGISEALTRGLTETIHVVENNTGTFRNTVLPLSRIELDPENPRKLAINLMDVRSGISPDDPLFALKQSELEKLKELSHTIKSSGIINPVVVYKLGETYRVVAGERRCLASILANKQEIEARVFQEKPRSFELKLIQWVENTAREDLSLAERLGNIREILQEYKNQFSQDEITASILKNITGLSLPQSSYYLTVLNAPQDVLHHIDNGSIRNLDKAALLANISEKEMRLTAIDACINGASLKMLRQIVSTSKSGGYAPKFSKSNANKMDEAKINLGSTSKPQVLRAIIHTFLLQPEGQSYRKTFEKINWKDTKQCALAFRQFIQIMETVV